MKNADCYNPDELILYEFAAEAIKKINKTDFKAIVITNQPSIAKNIASLEELSTIHKKLETELGNKGAKIDQLYFCPHHPQKGFPGERAEYKIDCDCRKPKPGMILKAATDFNIDTRFSFMIGDTEADILAGKNAGCYTVGVMTGYGVKSTSVLPDFFFSDLKESVDFILNNTYEEYFSQIVKNKTDHQPYIIGIGGNARSGKSNFAAFLRMRFEQSGYKVLTIELDNWILPEAERSSEMNVFDRYRLLDMINDLEKLLSGKPIVVNSYPIHPNRISAEINYDPKSAEIILIEGVVALSSPQLRNFYHNSVFIEASYENRKERFKKYYLWKEKSMEEIESLFISRIKDEYDLIEKDRKFAGLVIEN
jgi:histidinol-phosphate phosphatase family protein